MLCLPPPILTKLPTLKDMLKGILQISWMSPLCPSPFVRIRTLFQGSVLPSHSKKKLNFVLSGCWGDILGSHSMTVSTATELYTLKFSWIQSTIIGGLWCVKHLDIQWKRLRWGVRRPSCPLNPHKLMEVCKASKCNTKRILSGGFERNNWIEIGDLRRQLRGSVSEFHTETRLICQKRNGSGGEHSRLRK